MTNIADDLQRHAHEADVELHLGHRRAWLIALGPIDASRAAALVALVTTLADRLPLDRGSVDLTCAWTTDRTAADDIDALRHLAPASIDVTTAGPLSHHAA